MFKEIEREKRKSAGRICICRIEVITSILRSLSKLQLRQQNFYRSYNFDKILTSIRHISDTIGPHLGPICEHPREQKKVGSNRRNSVDANRIVT
jgi:hypothetical protein